MLRHRPYSNVDEQTEISFRYREPSRSEKVKGINEYIKVNAIPKYHYYCMDMPDYDVDNIYQLYVNNIPIDTENETDNFYYGLYYFIRDDFPNLEKYLLKAIAKWNRNAMNLLAEYYKTNKQYDKMKYYYLLAVECGDTIAMYKLGMYYNELNEYELMKKYFDMALNTCHDPEHKKKLRKNILLEYMIYHIKNK